MKTVRLALIPVILAVAPIARYLCGFQIGREGKPIDLGMGNDLFLILIAPFIVGLTVAFVTPVRGFLRRLGVGLIGLVITPMLVMFAVPAGAVIYTHGFEHAIKKDIGIATLQQWAEEALTRFHQGTLTTSGEASYWSPGSVIVLTNELPRFLKTGLFAPSGIPNYGPEISICTNNKIAGDCIAMSWYDHGLLVGSPQFTNDWNPYYCKRLGPGVYSYYAGK